MDHGRFMRQVDCEIEAGRAALLALYDEGISRVRRALDYQHSERMVRLTGHRNFEAFLQAEIKSRALRSQVMPAAIFGEPAWDILLEVTLGHLRKKTMSATCVAKSGGTPATTGNRWISVLLDERLLEQVADHLDHRRKLIRLTGKGWAAMSAWLEQAVLL